MAPWKWHIHSASQRTQQGHRSWTQSSRESTGARLRVAAKTHCRRQEAREGALGQRLARKPQFPRLNLLAAAQPTPTPTQTRCLLANEPTGTTGPDGRLVAAGPGRKGANVKAVGHTGEKRLWGVHPGKPRATLEKGDGRREATAIMFNKTGLV